MSRKKDKLIIGRSELIDLPEIKLRNLNAKVDTGAYTSSIHCNSIKLVTINGKKVLKFDVLDPSHPKYEKKYFKFKKFKEARIKNSFGKSEKRFIIEMDLKIYGQRIKTEFSLSDRSNMKFPILLGRKFIQKGFVVDVTKTNLSKKASLK